MTLSKIKYFKKPVMALTGIIFMCALSSCAKPHLAVNPEAAVIPSQLYQTPATPTREDGSIWPGDSNDNLLFVDAKAHDVGDIVTVIVDESATSSQKASTDVGKDATLDMDWSALFGLDRNLGIDNFLGSADPFDPRVSAQLSRNSKGEGTTTREGTLSARISVVVVQAFDNGNFAIEGRRSITVNNEEQLVVLRGIIREVDIDFDNTISSRYIANASISYAGEGVVADEQRVGWLTRALTYVWPF
jgi:flagellar L-ring protein precursor FlgH